MCLIPLETRSCRVMFKWVKPTSISIIYLRLLPFIKYAVEFGRRGTTSQTLLPDSKRKYFPFLLLLSLFIYALDELPGHAFNHDFLNFRSLGSNFIVCYSSILHTNGHSVKISNMFYFEAVPRESHLKILKILSLFILIVIG